MRTPPQERRARTGCEAYDLFMPPMLPTFNREEIQHFLTENGYTSNPQGLPASFPVDYISESEGVAYVDLTPEAVRKGTEVPKRPVRITFYKMFDDWQVKSVGELVPGIESKARDRDQLTPKIPRGRRVRRAGESRCFRQSPSVFEFCMSFCWSTVCSRVLPWTTVCRAQTTYEISSLFVSCFAGVVRARDWPVEI